MSSSNARRSPRAQHLSQHDQELLAAKNRGNQVRFQLQHDMYFADTEAVVDAFVIAVDKYAVKIDLSDEHGDEGQQIWLAKQSICSTEELR